MLSQKPKAIYKRTWKKANPGIAYQYMKVWIKKHPGKQQQLARNWNLKKFGLTPADEKTHCEVCGALPKGRVTRLFIDHCHITGKFRGFLCVHCNLALGHLKDNPNLIKRLLHYSRRANGKHNGKNRSN